LEEAGLRIMWPLKEEGCINHFAFTVLFSHPI
jgi:hypothetical protein